MAGDRQPAWQALRAGRYGVSPTVPGTDPMWIWSDATDYREHRAFDRAAGVAAVIDDADHGAARPRFRGVRNLPIAAYRSERARGVHIELAMPVVPCRPRRPRLAPDTAIRDEKVAPTSNKARLVAVIDSGCPFAARMLRAPDGGTRVLALWDQDPHPSFANAGGYRPTPLGYGCAVGRDELDALMERARAGSAGAARSRRDVDEALCYRLAAYDTMRSRTSHGAGVLSQLLAAPIRGGALQPIPGTPPRWDETGAPPIDDADVVFVQLPRDAVQDSTSAGLARNVVDGLRFVLDRAGKNTRHIVVTISSGTSRSLHDGTSLVERAISAWIDEADRRGIDARVVIPTGNTHDEQRHAVLSNPGHSLELMIPPDVEMPQYITVRCAAADAVRVVLRVTPPGGPTGRVACGQALGWPDAKAPSCGVIRPRPASGMAAIALIVVAPTSGLAADARGATKAATPTAPSGRWRIEIESSDGAPLGLDEPVCFWVSRNQRNPGAAARSRQAYFVDRNEGHQPGRYLRTHHDVDDSALRNGVRRAGAWSGAATLARRDGRLIVVGGYVGGGDRPQASDYSAAGPAAGRASNRRQGPDFSAPADTNRATPGLTVRANLSGAVARMRGTSFAAPLVARAACNNRLDLAARQPKPLTLSKRPTTAGGTAADVGQTTRLGRCLKP